MHIIKLRSPFGVHDWGQDFVWADKVRPEAAAAKTVFFYDCPLIVNIMVKAGDLLCS